MPRAALSAVLACAVAHALTPWASSGDSSAGRSERAGGDGFVFLTYNILAKSLGSSTIPWVMNAKGEVKVAVEAETGPWEAWVKAKVTPHYVRHFHKNYASGDTIAMRQFWSARACRGQEDIPAALTGVAFAGEDRVAYVDPKSSERVEAVTMRGLLRDLLGEKLGLRLYEHLMEEEESVFDWATRGPRLFQEALRQVDFPGVPLGARAPDLVVLQEYDAFLARAAYRPGAPETFAQAMAAAGFGHAWFPNPGQSAGSSGLGVFWRHSLFELNCSGGDGGPPILAVAIGKGDYAAAAVNLDLEEHRHELGGDGPGAFKIMPEGDRRNLAMVRLRHRPSGRNLWVANAHLMTESRDGAKTNAFPGEVRAGELRRIRQEVQLLVKPGEAVVFAGDFNTDASELKRFTAPLEDSMGTGRTLEVDTGLEFGEGTAARFRWRAGEEPLLLREAFEQVHRWGPGVGTPDVGGQCTSRNAKRADWIDYVWYAEEALTMAARLAPAAPWAPIPDKQHPSDHLPLRVLFDFKGPRLS